MMLCFFMGVVSNQKLHKCWCMFSLGTLHNNSYSISISSSAPHSSRYAKKPSRSDFRSGYAANQSSYSREGGYNAALHTGEDTSSTVSSASLSNWSSAFNIWRRKCRFHWPTKARTLRQFNSKQNVCSYVHPTLQSKYPINCHRTVPSPQPHLSSCL